MKLEGNLPPGHDVLPFATSGMGSFINYIPSRTDTATHTKAVDYPVMGHWGESHLGDQQVRGRREPTTCQSTRSTFSPEVHDWVNKELGMSSRVCTPGYIKDPVPLIEKSRASCPSGRFPPSFIHQVIIITGLQV